MGDMILVSNKILRIQNDEYKKWISELKKRYRNSQIKAAVKVNNELLRFYWMLGKDISIMQEKAEWGSSFYDSLSKDLQDAFPGTKGFSVRNLQYMKQFYCLFKGEVTIASNNEIDDHEFTHQVGAQIFEIPWNHLKLIMSKCAGDVKVAMFYINETIKNNWSRAVLLNFLDTNLYERQGKAVSNFEASLPKAEGLLAQEITKDPYNFDFLTIREDYDEAELKKSLVNNIQKFLLELGTGFAFVGKEYRLSVGDTEQFTDLLFYNIRIHAYVVIEVKVTEFEPSYIGQLGTYCVAVDHILKSEKDEKTIGLLVCKYKDDVVAKYALESSNQPIGVSAYELSNLIPENFKSSLPTIEEIEAELNEK